MKVVVISVIEIKNIKNNIAAHIENWDNTLLVCELYRKFEEISLECFPDDEEKNYLCYDQLCIYVDSINDNMCKVENITKLICTIYQSGLCEVSYEEI